VLKVIWNWGSIMHNQGCFDLFQSLRIRVAKSKIDFDIFWIKGHQDDLGLPIIYEGHFNMSCDNITKDYCNEIKHNNDHFTTRRVLDKGWFLNIDNKYKTKVIQDELYYWSFDIKNSVNYSNTMIPLEVSSYKDINWNAIKSAIYGLPRSKRHCLT